MGKAPGEEEEEGEEAMAPKGTLPKGGIKVADKKKDKKKGKEDKKGCK